MICVCSDCGRYYRNHRKEPNGVCGKPATWRYGEYGQTRGATLCAECKAGWQAYGLQDTFYPLATVQPAPSPLQHRPPGPARIGIEKIVYELWNDLQMRVPHAAPQRSD